MYYFKYYAAKQQIQCNFNTESKYLDALRKAIHDGRLILSCGRLS